MPERAPDRGSRARMSRRLRRRRGVAPVLSPVLSPVLAVILIAAQGAPGMGQEQSFSLSQGFETTRNPEREAGREDDRRSLATTDLSYGLSSTTRRASLGVTMGLRLVGATGDLGTGEEEGFEIDRPRLAFRHSYAAPAASFRTTGSVERRNIGFLERLDLIENEDGTIEVPDDIDDLEGTGFRNNARLGFSADFGENRPFGWGVSVTGSSLTYDEVEGSALRDSTRAGAQAYGRFDLTPVLSLRTGLGYTLRTEEGEDDTRTETYDAVLTQRRADNGALRAGISLDVPEDKDRRLTLFVGASEEIDDLRSFDVNLGTTMAESGEARLVASIAYNQALSRTTAFTAGINREARDTSGNETVLDTAARLSLSHSLSRQSGVDFGLVYGARENFTTDADTSDLAVSLGYTHDLTRDWSLSVGASHIWRDETDIDTTTSDRLFFSIGRSWNSRF